MIRLAMASLALALVAPSCPGPAPVPPEPDVVVTVPDAGLSPCEAACTNLRLLQCIPDSPACVSVCVHAQTTGLVDLHVDCLAGATSKSAARLCGSVRCP